MKAKVVALGLVPAAILLAAFTAISQVEYFSVSIISERHGLTDHEAVFEIRNFDESQGRDFSLRVMFEQMNFPLELVSDVWIYELKPIEKAFSNHTERAEETTCQDEGNQTYTCNVTATIDNTYYAMALDWKPAKMNLVHQADRVSADYGNVNIPKSGSKCKYDDFGSEYGCDGTKMFKMTWKTPIVPAANGWGSSGYYSISDANTGFSYDPWWNASCAYKQPIEVNASLNLPAFQLDINIDETNNGTNWNWTEACAGGFRIVNEAEDGTHYFWIENCSVAGKFLNLTFLGDFDTGNGTQAYLYYECSGMPNADNGNQTFPILYDDCETNFNRWKVTGSPQINTTRFRSNASSGYFRPGQLDKLERPAESIINGSLEGWFYDGGESTEWFMMGIDSVYVGIVTATSATNYTYYAGGYLASKIPRSNGWRRFEYRVTTNISLYLDGQLVYTKADTNASYIEIGDWTGGAAVFKHVDDVLIRKATTGTMTYSLGAEEGYVPPVPPTGTEPAFIGIGDKIFVRASCGWTNTTYFCDTGVMAGYNSTTEEILCCLIVGV